MWVPEWDLADRLRKSLRESETGVQEIADHLGVNRNTISTWINGRGPVNPDCLPKWAVYTGFPREWIETGETGGAPTPPPPGIRRRRESGRRTTNLRAVTGTLADIDSDGVDEDAAHYVALAEDVARLPREDSNLQPFG
ncbi:hypothetical protein MMRN_39000 [Mycobacterium marinum]|nr:hypothetical protein MMRN_39000 [Mycobacterium marinum]